MGDRATGPIDVLALPGSCAGGAGARVEISTIASYIQWAAWSDGLALGRNKCCDHVPLEMLEKSHVLCGLGQESVDPFPAVHRAPGG